MSGIWFTSDLHLGHKLVASERGFDTTEEHDAALAANCDALVRPQDQVYVLGDLCMSRGSGGLTRALEWISERPGIKDLIWGNHDSGHPMHREAHKNQARYLGAFRSAQQSGIRKIGEHRVLLSHFPYQADHTAEVRYPQWRPPNYGEWLIHGHTHSSRQRYGSRQLHVGLDAHGLKPVPLKWIEEQMRKDYP